MKKLLILALLTCGPSAFAEVNLLPVPPDALTSLYLNSYTRNQIPADFTFVILLINQQPELNSILNSLKVDVDKRSITIGVNDTTALDNSPVLRALQDYAGNLKISIQTTNSNYRFK